jgi:hypothetical protein
MPPGSLGLPALAGPSVDYLGAGIQDHRLPYNTAQSDTGAGVVGFYGADSLALSFTPATKGTAKIVALANASSGVAMTLAAASTGITVVPTGGLLVMPSLNVVPAAALVIDGNPALKKFGNKGFTTFYDRASLGARALSITGVSGGAGGDFIISGYDTFGYPMTEKITAAAGIATTAGKKAWKFVTSVVPQFSDAHNYSVGTLDIFGLPIKTLLFSDSLIHWNDALITANTGFVVPDATTPATNTTGDVRGTYAVQDAADGTKRLVIRCWPSLTAVQADPTIGLFGVAQV